MFLNSILPATRVRLPLRPDLTFGFFFLSVFLAFLFLPFLFGFCLSYDTKLYETKKVFK